MWKFIEGRKGEEEQRIEEREIVKKKKGVFRTKTCGKYLL